MFRMIRWVRQGTKRPNSKPQPKNAEKIHVWGAVSGAGKSEIHLFRQNLNAKYYTEEILPKFALPFYKKTKRKYPDACFQGDNDPKHTSAQSKKYLVGHFTRYTHRPPPPCRVKIPQPPNRKRKRGRHPSKPAKECRCQLGELVVWCANSPDLSIQENNWSWMKRHIWADKKKHPKNIKQLEAAINKAWKELPQSIINA